MGYPSSKGEKSKAVLALRSKSALLPEAKKQRTAKLRQKSAEPPAAPFLKWAGGKSKLIPALSKFFPQSFQRYFEPFAGGAAVFFHLRNTIGEFKAEISDLNPELVNCYRVIRDNPEALINELQKHQNNPEHFYRTRALDPRRLTVEERAARIIYLNKTCFNGLYRENSKGQFNVPFGSYKNPNFCNQDALKSCSRALSDTEISCASFKELLQKAEKGDFIYFDPPYHPLSSSSNFTSYTKNSFGTLDQEELSCLFQELDRRGCYLLLSNSDCQFIRRLYKKQIIETVYALRAINCKGEGRGKISEVLIMNQALLRTY